MSGFRVKSPATILPDVSTASIMSMPSVVTFVSSFPFCGLASASVKSIIAAHLKTRIMCR